MASEGVDSIGTAGATGVTRRGGGDSERGPDETMSEGAHSRNGGGADAIPIARPLIDPPQRPIACILPGQVVAALVVRRGSTISNCGPAEEGMGGEEGEDNLNMNSVVAARRGGGVGLGD